MGGQGLEPLLGGQRQGRLLLLPGIAGPAVLEWLAAGAVFACCQQRVGEPTLLQFWA